MAGIVKEVIMKKEPQKTKVWIVIWGLKDGGAETLAREYARLVNPDKFDATIVTMYPFTNTANYRRAQEAGLKMRSIFSRRNMFTRAIRIFLGRWYVPFTIKRMLAKERPDTIHFNSEMACHFATLKKELSGINLLYTCHSEVDKHFTDVEEAAVHLLIQNHDLRLIALHEDMRKELNQRFRKKDTVVIRNGIDLSRFRHCGIERSAKRESIKIPQDAWVIGHVGRFSKEKNHTFLLKVFREIVRRKSNAHLLLVGNGELQEEIMQEINRMNLHDRVTILSHRMDIPELLRVMDVMVFPSFFEGLSVTLVEAQAAGLKCVISDSINPANILSEKTISVSLEQGPSAWADIALDDSIKTEHYGNIDDYDMNREIHRLEGLYVGQLDV